MMADSSYADDARSPKRYVGGALSRTQTIAKSDADVPLPNGERCIIMRQTLLVASGKTSLLAQIQSDALDEGISISGALRKCLILGGVPARAPGPQTLIGTNPESFSPASAQERRGLSSFP